jgi:glycosyltransferase involved in cell wall biosynthesis
METPKLSVTIITFNEEENIRDCLESVKWADEIIVVDSFSTDKTVEICNEYTEKVLQRKWPGFLKQKHFAQEQATGDWILNLDADERLSLEAATEIKKEILNGTPDVDGFVFHRQSYYLGRWIKHGGWYPDAKLRLIRKDSGRWSGESLHEKLVCDGKVKRLNGKILHYVYRDIAHQLETVDSFSRISADIWLKKGKRFKLFLLLTKPPISFLTTYIWKGGILDGIPGFIISVITSYYVFLKYAKLWELRKNQQPTA